MTEKLVLSLLTIAAILVAIDIKKHNRFEDSNTSGLLKFVGLLEHAESAFRQFRAHCQQVYWWAKLNGPIYLEKVRANFILYLLILIDIMKDVILRTWVNIQVFYQYCVDQIPWLVQSVNHYAPRSTDRLYLWANKTWHMLKEYAQFVKGLVLEYITVLVKWLKENVFVGNLSFEKLMLFAVNVLKTTQSFAMEVYSWIIDSTDQLIKLKYS